MLLKRYSRESLSCTSARLGFPYQVFRLDVLFDCVRDAFLRDGKRLDLSSLRRIDLPTRLEGVVANPRIRAVRDDRLAKLIAAI